MDHGLKVMKRKKVKVSAGRKKKNKDINVVATQRPEDDEVDLEEQSGELMILVCRYIAVFCAWALLDFL